MLGLQRTVASIAYLWDIVFVNQPAVQGYKYATNQVYKPGKEVDVPSSWKYASYNKLKLYYTSLIEAKIISEEALQQEVYRLGYSMNNAPAVYAAILSILNSRGNFEAKELISYGRMTPGLRDILEDARYNIFTDGMKMPAKLGEGPDKNHSYHQNIEGGKDMWFSTYFLAKEIGQPEALGFDANLLKGQAIGTVQSLTTAGRSVALITFDTTTEAAEQDTKEFFAQVSEILTPNLPAASSAVQLVDRVEIVSITNKNIKSKYWETAGCRGDKTNPDDFSIDNVSRQVAGFAEEVLERMSRGKYASINGKTVRVAFAFDSRKDSDVYAYEMAKVLAAYKGFEVEILDEALPTPIVASLTQRKRPQAYDFAFHVTPSHNQLQYGGIKLLFEGSVNEHMWTYFFEKRANGKMEYPVNPNAQFKRVHVIDQLTEEYLQDILPGLIEKFASFRRLNPDTQFIIDLMDGSMASFARLFERLGITVVRSGRMKDIDYSGRTYILADGKKVGFAPDPTQSAFYEDQPKFKQFKDTAANGSIYFIIDGDGDRLVTIVKKDGKLSLIKPNQFGPLAADYILTNHLLPEVNQIVRTYVTSAGMDALARYHGLPPPVIVPVGSKYFNRFVPHAIALEESGHFVAGTYFDDTIYQMGLILLMMSESNKDVFTLLAEIQKKTGYKGIDKRDDFENLSPEVKAKFIEPLTGTPDEVRVKSRNAVNEIVAQSDKELLEALVVVEGEYGIGRVVELKEYVDSLSSNKPLVIEGSNKGIIVRFTDLSWGGARLSGTGNTGRLYTEGRESDKERQKIADAFINTLGLPVASSAVQIDESSEPEAPSSTLQASSLEGASFLVRSAPETTGGIDFRALPMTIQPMGSFQRLNFKLPRLSQIALEEVNIDSEMQQIRNMVQSGIIPSGQRIKELIAACVQKGRINSQIENLLLCLADTFKLEEENASESSAELREALVIVDSQS